MKKWFEESDLLINGVSEIVENEVKQQWGWFWGMLEATLGASLLGNMLVGTGERRVGEGTIGAGQDF